MWENLLVRNAKLKAHRGPNKHTSHGQTPLPFLTGYQHQNPIHNDWLETIPAQDIPVQTLLPSFKDWADLQKRMVALISRTLARNIAYLKPLTKKYVEQHVEHEYSLESKMRSEIVSINLTYKWMVFNEGLFS